ncbi:MAG: sugar transferase [Proteobacteria bacterium]|nr:sugar transferase [Pseudomonadota bacterium]
MLYFPKKKFMLFILDVLFLSLAFVLSNAIRFQKLVLSDILFFQLLLIVVIYTLIFYIFDFYDLRQSFGNVRFFLKFQAGCLVGFLLLSTIFYFLPYLKTGRSVLILTVFYIYIFCFLVRYFFEKIVLKIIIGSKNVIIVGTGSEARFLYEALKEKDHIHIKSFIEPVEAFNNFYFHPVMVESCSTLMNPKFLDNVDLVVIATKEKLTEDILKCMLYCKSKNVDVIDMPTYYEEVFGKVPVNFIDYEWFIASRLYGLKKTVYNTRLKGVIDSVVAFVGLLLSLPVLLFAMLLIIIDDGLPVIFRQKRVGKDGKLFTSYKLRTMKVGHESFRDKAGEVDDPRVTRVGRLLRKFRIDEIPQMWNVLRGEISFIGPRALIPEEVEKFTKEIPFFGFRHNVKPGITGWAQVNYKHGVSIEDALEKLQYDLYYIKHLSPILDLYIFLKTIKVVVLGRGAR